MRFFVPRSHHRRLEVQQLDLDGVF
ncbi:MAG: hypothetical protein RIS79_562, partial [Verrucomicrobiota bacterium]